mmetsp:Transcript_41600/g.134412  ORF Transcript_41600/g.134412 Transcript_41600/m.134412 type:complete len:276 (+) Transcript_41600:474-1301(+)
MGSPAQCTLNGTSRSRTRAQQYPRRASPLGRSQRRRRRRTGNRAPQRAERRNHSRLCSGASRAVCRLLRRRASRLPAGPSSSTLRQFAPLGEGRVHRHQVLPLLCELRRVKVREEALDEGEDEDVPERRERDEQDDHGGYHRDEVLCDAAQNLRLLRPQRVPLQRRTREHRAEELHVLAHQLQPARVEGHALQDLAHAHLRRLERPPPRQVLVVLSLQPQLQQHLADVFLDGVQLLVVDRLVPLRPHQRYHPTHRPLQCAVPLDHRQQLVRQRRL